jgi:uncharacterized membrane protein
MKPKHFLERIDEARVLSAIAEAERKSSGELRVYISHRPRADALKCAQARFVKLGMTKTRQHNAVLIYLRRGRQFAVVGDAGIHEKCGEDFWKDIAAKMTALLKAGDYTNAIVTAIQETGELLARHFRVSPVIKTSFPIGSSAIERLAAMALGRKQRKNRRLAKTFKALQW